MFQYKRVRRVVCGEGSCVPRAGDRAAATAPARGRARAASHT